MAKIPGYRRIFKQDYSTDNQEDIATLGITVNDSFETIYGALTNQITLAENINCTLITFTTSVDEKGVPTTPTVLKLNNFQKSVNGVLALNAVESKGGGTLPTGGLFISYTLNNNLTASSNVTNSGNNNSNPATLNINNIIGLPANKIFNITVVVL